MAKSFWLPALAALLLLAAACGSNDVGSNDADSNEVGSNEAGDNEAGSNEANSADPSLAGTTITLITHDSFTLSPGTLIEFERSTGITVKQLAVGDTGVLVAQSILNKDNPLGDVLYGIDNTFLSRALNEDIFTPYRSPALSGIDPALSLELDDQNRVTPINFGDVCVNYWANSFLSDTPAPTSISDLTLPAYANKFVVQNPETSSPGLAFLLATIAIYGDGWEHYWTSLRNNGVLVTADWNSAYYGEFVAGDGDRPIVVSYASSPPAEFMFADAPLEEAPSAVITDSCFRQVEYAGILAGTPNEAAAQALIDFMLSPTLQNDVPLNMFVYPVLAAAELPQVFLDYSVVPENPLTMSAAEIEANRDAWTQRWVEIVLR